MKQNKLFVETFSMIKNPSICIVILFALVSYGYAISHFAIGVDDTDMRLYYETGFAVNSGRWTLFFLNRILHLNIISWPTPLVETIALILLCVGALLWAGTIRLVFEECGLRIPEPIAAIAVALFVSDSILSELWVYYLHNGMCIGYCLCAMALYQFYESMRRGCERRDVLLRLLFCSVLLTISVGCYESMLQCFVVGAILIFFILHTVESGTHAYGGSIVGWIVKGMAVCLVVVLLRTGVLYVIQQCYHLAELSIGYNQVFGGLLSEPGSISLLIKKLYLRYYVQAFVYLPITVYVISMGVLCVISLLAIIKRRDIYPILCVCAIVLFQIVMSIVGGGPESYHSAQFLPIISLSAFLLIGAYGVKCGRKKLVLTIQAVCGILVCIFQSADMNKWFIQDYRKYEEASTIMIHVAEDLLSGYDTSKPLVVEGATLPSGELYEAACIPFSSWQYRMICRCTDPIDIHLKEKFHMNYEGLGYAYAESPLLSVLTWAHNPFQNASVLTYQQYTNLWAMLGYDEFTYIDREEWLEEAVALREEKDMPGYPQEGYIYETDRYILISLSPSQSGE